MKKILSLVFMVAAMMYATSANAQIKFGLKGGLNVTSMSFSEDVFDASNKTGFFVGPMVKVTVPIVGLSFDAAALYDQKEADVKYNIDDEFGKTNVKQQSINIPVNVRYGFGLSSLANVFLFAGPQWGFNVGSKNFDLEKITKADKLGPVKARMNAEKWMHALEDRWEALPPYFITSSEKKTGRDEVLDYIDEINKSLAGE